MSFWNISNTAQTELNIAQPKLLYNYNNPTKDRRNSNLLVQNSIKL